MKIPPATLLVSLLFYGVLGAAAAPDRKTLDGHRPAVARIAGADQPLEATNRLSLTLGLRLPDPEGLSNFLRDLYSPGSTNFHRYLTPQQFAKKFGPSESDYQSVIQFARANGFTVTGRHEGRMVLEVNAASGAVEKAFQTRLLTRQHPTEKRRFYFADSDPSVPAEVPIIDIGGLDDYQTPQPLGSAVRMLDGTSAVSSADYYGSGPDGTYTPADLRGVYEMGASINGAGQSVGLLEFDTFFPNDLLAFEREEGLPRTPVRTVALPGVTGAAGRYNGEPALDVEVTIGMAPGLSSVIMYQGPQAGSYRGGFDSLLILMAEQDAAAQLSSSWSPPVGKSALEEQIYQQMAAQGQTFFQASGDHGAYTNEVVQQADNPYTTIVGGTELGPYDTETVWNNGVSNQVSGGGIGTNYLIPSWQQSVDMAAVGGSTNWRNIPDVAAAGDGVYVRFNNGHRAIFEGTSIASPLWAAFTALVNQQARSNNLPYVGFLNPDIYAIGQSANYGACLRDSTTGNNTTALSPNNFYAATGYDLCTGWGSPIGQSLIDALTIGLAPLSVTVSNSVFGDGPAGGRFLNDQSAMFLTNTGYIPAQWAISEVPPWLTLSATQGTVDANQAVTISMSLSSFAASLPASNYTATVILTDLTRSIRRSITLTLNIGTGSVSITITPLSAVCDGLQWRIDLGPWLNSGEIASNLSSGLHLVSFSSPVGWIPPPDHFVFVSSGETTNESDAAVEAYSFVTVAGSAGVAGSDDGTNSSARFSSPNGITVDSAGNLFVADTGNDTIRMLSPQGSNWVVTTIAGLAGSPGYAFGTNNAARFDGPYGISAGPPGVLYMTDFNNFSIDRLSQAGTNWVASNIGTEAGGNSTAVAADPSGGFYETDLGDPNRNYDSLHYFSESASGWSVVNYLINYFDQVNFGTPYGVTVVPGQGPYVANTSGNKIETIQSGPSYYGTTFYSVLIAGSGSAGSDDGIADVAQFSSPKGIAADAFGNVYIADTGNETIRKLNPFGSNAFGFPDYVVTTVGGSATNAGSADGMGNLASFNAPSSLAVDSNETIYVSDTSNDVIRIGGCPLRTVQVIAGPSSPDLQSAQFQVDGGPWAPVNSSLRLLQGVHTVAFSPAPGWTTPPTQFITNSPNSVVLTAAYTKPSGSLTVTLGPSNAVAAGAAWQIDDGRWESSGSTLSEVALGEHTLIFSNLSSWAAPPPALISVNSGANSFAYAYNALETQPPSLFIQSPLPGQTWTNGSIVVTGVASDNEAVASVWVSLNGGAAVQAIGTRTWQSPSIFAPPGKVTVQAYADDTSGNSSPVKTVQFFNAPRFSVTVTTSGDGSVTPKLSGHFLPYGQQLAFTAMPASGWIFSNWVGDVASENATVAFKIQSNTTLQANFAPTPFSSLAGAYTGLFYDPYQADQSGSGFFSAQLSRQGFYSGAITIEGAKESFSGQFSAGGTASNYFARPLNPISLQLTLDLSGSNGISGELTSPNWESSLIAFRSAWSKSNAAPEAGRYTVRFPAPGPDSEFPGGDGFGAATVDALGNVQFSGTLGDETAISQAAVISENGQWPFYASFNNGTGVILGWLNFTNLPDRDLTGIWNWIKTPQPAAALYPDGFFFSGNAEGSAYTYTKGKPILALTNGTLAFSDGNLSSAFSNQLTLGANNSVVNHSSNALSLSISTATGLFHGAATVPGSHTSVPFGGAILQKQNAGFGLFLNKSNTGPLTLGQGP